ncbi:gluconokinase [Miniimonas arenae]|uniref:gluconokinase n=1 Tax=Miniimonas arenae TaxID=676201 RepID=UPI0028AB9ADC|nr:gluconokinase [Miniimonas arenae]
MTHTHLVIMGVAGSGKTTVLHRLGELLHWSVAEGDAFHPEANVAKMSEGTPLTDEDRWPWLDRIVTWTAVEDAAGRDTLVTCSALRRAYRDRLRQAPGRTVFAHLAGTTGLIEERMTARTDHFMPTTLLPSQFATLEPLQDDEDGIVVDVLGTPEDVAREIVRRLQLEPVSA